MFKQNYLNELPDDIQDKIWTIVNKEKFNICLNKIDNIKIKKFHTMYDLINDPFFGVSLELYGDTINQGLSWFHKATDAEIDEDKNYAYEMYQRDRCLNWKNYTTPKPEYQNTKCVRFGYCNNWKFSRAELVFIHRHINAHIAGFDGDICISKMTFRNNYIDVYFNKLFIREETETATDIIYKIYWGYKLINECLKYTANSGGDTHYLIEWFDNHSFLECFQIKNKIIEPFFGS
jgi:hypothetical protein